MKLELHDPQRLTYSNQKHRMKPTFHQAEVTQLIIYDQDNNEMVNESVRL